jgi:hypothetical protein
MPKVQVNARNRFTGVDINELHIYVRVNTNDILSDIPSHIFAIDVCKTLSEGWEDQCSDLQ